MNATVKPDGTSASFAPTTCVYQSVFVQLEAEAAFMKCQEMKFRKLEMLT